MTNTLHILSLVAYVDGELLHVPDGGEFEEFVSIQSTHYENDSSHEKQKSWAYARRRGDEFIRKLRNRYPGRFIRVAIDDCGQQELL